MACFMWHMQLGGSMKRTLQRQCWHISKISWFPEEIIEPEERQSLRTYYDTALFLGAHPNSIQLCANFVGQCAFARDTIWELHDRYRVGLLG